MWTRLYLACIAFSTAWTQHTSARVSQDGTSFGWGWRLPPLGDAAGTVGHYYVNLPQSKQEVRYSADDSRDRGAGRHNMNEDHHTHSHNFRQEVIELTTQPIQSQQTARIQNATATTPTRHPVDIYLLRQQYSTYITQNTPPNTKGLTQLYNIQSEHNYGNEDTKPFTIDSKPLRTGEANEYRTPLLQVFKDHNCSDLKASVDLQKDLNKSKELFSQVPYQLHDIDDFGVDRPLSYRGAVKFRVEPTSADTRAERFFYTTIETPVDTDPHDTQQGIDRLVASTQDLISNEDLLSINHAVENHVHEQSDDLIKPRPQWIFRHLDTDSQDSRNHFTVQAKIENILNSSTEDGENNESKRIATGTTSNDYNFAIPIFVPDPTYNNVKDQIVNNLVSTMVPYIADGYEIVGVKNGPEDNTTDKGLVNVTPRPVSQTYLAPITVALRLLNNDTTNLLDDHEAADSELISDTVQSPDRERTVVEIQESIPGDITHINDVEVHEYLDEGRSNDKGSLDFAKSLYHKYVDALKSSKKIQDNMNKLLYRYGTMSTETNEEQQYETNDSLEPSENVHKEVEVDPDQNNGNNQRSESASYYNDYNDQQKIIQPIIIEKEVPITQFVDRFIEKQVQVPYTQTLEVQVPVDRPVPVAVPYEKIVEKPVEVTRYVDKPYPVEVPRPYPVEVQVPYPVEHKIYIDRPVHIPYPVEKVIDRHVLHPVPVPTPIGIPYEVKVPVEHKVYYPVQVEKPVAVPVEIEKPVERIVNREVPVPYPVERRVPYPVHYETRVPVPYPVEKRIPVPVERIIEKPVTVTKFIEKPVRVEVPVPQPVAVPVHVPQPYPVDRIVERKVPYPVPVDRIVEKKVNVNVPYPVEKIVEKIVEKPVVVTKYVDKPYPVEKKVPYPGEKIVEKRVPYPVQVPVQVGLPYQVQKGVDKTLHIPINIYRYGPREHVEESRINPQYYNNEGRLRNAQALTQLAQYYQLLKERQKVATAKNTNQYASSYQYVNNVTGRNQDEKIIGNKTYQYFGPPPDKDHNDWWERNKNLVEYKLRRADREPRVTNLRIEYGGFKPPLVPSTEVDLDGIPVNQET